MTLLDRVKLKYPDLIIQDFTDNYLTFYNPTCKHTCRIRIDRVLYNGVTCNAKECKSKNCSEAQRLRFINPDERLRIAKLTKQALASPEKRQRISQGVLKANENPIKKLNLLIGQAQNQRNKRSPFELSVLDILERYDIKYQWQYPVIIKELPFDAIFDIYLPDFDIYININLDACHKKYPQVSYKDKLLKDYFKDRLLIIESMNDLLTFLSLKGVVI